MVGRFVWWFIVFALSFLAQSKGIADQGTAFFYIHFCGIIIISIFSLLLFIYRNNLSMKISVISIICSVIFLAFVFLLPCVILTLFNVNFYLTYQIVSLILCLFNLTLTIQM